ncbi:hypothetical protein MTY414_77700 [Mycolicibacterium mageritense]|nr:hypothetical protein MTY414_77700 [Mycolicibacterium mageritense]
MGLARGYSLAVVEGSLLPLTEWAAGAAAVNLLTGQTTTSEVAADARKDLDSVIFYGGRNGWTSPDEKAQVNRPGFAGGSSYWIPTRGWSVRDAS